MLDEMRPTFDRVVSRHKPYVWDGVADGLRVFCETAGEMLTGMGSDERNDDID